MSVEEKPEAREFYLGRVDEAFAEMFFLFGRGFGARMEVVPGTSDVREVFSGREEKADSAGAIDFELSSCECGRLEYANPAKHIGTSVCTSSSAACSAEAGRLPATWILSTTAG